MKKYFYGLGEFYKLIEETQDHYIFERVDIEHRIKVEKGKNDDPYFEISKDEFLIRYDIPTDINYFESTYRKRAKKYNIKFNLNLMKNIYNLYNIKLTISKLEDNRAVVIFEDYDEFPTKTNVSIINNIDEFIIFENDKKEYKLFVETWNYKDITKFYDMLSGYKYKTKLFVIDWECQKVGVEIFDLDLKKCEKLLELFRDEMFLEVYKNNIAILKIDNQ